MAGIREYLQETTENITSVDTLLESIKDSTKNQKVADELGVTRQYVKQTLNRAAPKIWKAITELYPDDRPAKKFYLLAQMFNIDKQDIKSFYKIFPDAIRKEIEKDSTGLNLK